PTVSATSRHRACWPVASFLVPSARSTLFVISPSKLFAGSVIPSRASWRGRSVVPSVRVLFFVIEEPRFARDWSIAFEGSSFGSPAFEAAACDGCLWREGAVPLLSDGATCAPGCARRNPVANGTVTAAAATITGRDRISRGEGRFGRAERIW